MEKIWYRTWVYVGHESEVPEKNDYVTKSMGPTPIIMVRDREGDIRLLLNKCPHRGNQLCAYKEGNSKAFVCPYHAWTFSNTGDLMGYALPDGYEGISKRSEEHTSELQSLMRISYAVFCLKKK